MSTNRLQRVKIEATGVERRGGRVRRCVNLVRTRGALKKMSPVPSADSNGGEGGGADGSVAFERRTAVYEPVRLVARTVGRMQRQTSAFTPSEYDPGRRSGMSDKDVASLSDMLGSAYCGLVAEAAENGMMFQPVACGYRLTGADGSVLYDSGVQLTGVGEGVQLCGVMHPGLNWRGASDFTIADFAIEAEAYALEAEIPAYDAESGVAEVEIYVGEQIHPVDPDGLAEVRIDGASGNNPSVRLALPGATTAMMPNLRSLTAKARMLSGCGMGWMRVAARVKAGEARTIRVADAARGGVYDPESGEGCCGERVELKRCFRRWLVPAEMVADPRMKACRRVAEIERLRAEYDFEFWAWRCVEIADKQTGRMMRMKLNRPQRKLLGVMEGQRREGKPVRVILLKSRQWGGSTLTQIYFAWLQTVVAEGLNSLICAQVLNTSGTIRRMYDRLLRNYPRELCADEEQWRRLKKGLTSSGDGSSTRMVSGRRATVTVGSSFGQDAVRGLDIRLAHLSEVAFWRDTDLMKPADFVRAICSGIALQPLTAVVIESTANGVGNYFHREWLRAKDGLSDKAAVFVGWHEIEENVAEAGDIAALAESMDRYERNLWRRGLTLEQIRWYQLKRREAPDHAKVMAEYPTDDTEAFVNSGFGVFAPELVDRMRSTCHDPVAVGEVGGRALIGPDALRGVKFTADAKGGLKVWEWPANERHNSDRYVVTVDIGGRSAGADWSVIAVMDRGEADGSGPMRIAAQWRGHIDHDLLGWKAAAIAAYYNEALLVVESNTLETERAGSSTYILEQLSECYGHLYARTLRDTFSPQRERRLGFHTNRQTKGLIVESLIRAVREHEYLERDHLACDEMMTYTQLPGGGYAARDGCHDDVVMTRGMAVYVASTVGRSPEASCSYFRGR